MKKITFVLAAILVLSLIAGCGGNSNSDKKLKAGFVYVGPVEDAGWTKSHDIGRLQMEELPYVGESIYVESVPESAEAVRVIKEMAENGCDMIFTTSFGYMDLTMEVAAEYPDVKFHHATGYKKSENATNYMGRMYQAKYLAGIIAGEKSKSGKIGYVAPFPIPEVVRLINGFTLGAQSVNPDAEVMVLWTNSWFDPVHEKEAANTMIAAGCDVITQGADSAGPQEAAEAVDGVLSIGYDSDMSMYAPESHLTSPVWHWGKYYSKVAEDIHNGTWTNEPIWWGIETGICGLSPYNDKVSQELQDRVAKRKQEIIADDDIFEGPIYDNQGKLRVEEGQRLTDQEMLSIQWFVKGVDGKIPEEK